jgi:anti-anti-sigma factor
MSRADGPSSEAVPEPLRIEVRPHRETIVVAAEGELDLGSADQLRTQLLELLGAGFQRVVLDLRGVSFVDSTGLRTILDAEAASRGTGVEFSLVPGPAPVQRVFTLTGTDATLRFIEPRQFDGGAP